MGMRARWLLSSACVIVATCAAVGDARAEDGYGYEFADDPLVAGGFGP